MVVTSLIQMLRVSQGHTLGFLPVRVDFRDEKTFIKVNRWLTDLSGRELKIADNLDTNLG